MTEDERKVIVAAIAWYSMQSLENQTVLYLAVSEMLGKKPEIPRDEDVS